jgi:hypothetical protein
MSEIEQPQTQLKFPYIFLLISVLLIAGLYFVIVFSLEKALSAAIIEATEAGNAAVTRIFINEVYPELEKDLALNSNKTALSADAFQRVDQRVRRFMIGTDILKAKLYNNAGITLYSSDPSQVGENKLGNSGMNSALQGVPASQVTFRGKFSALDGQVFDRDLVASYIPIRDDSQRVIGVAELYADRSPVIRYSRELVLEVKSELIPLLITILLLVSLIIWRFTSYVTRLRIEMAFGQRNDTDVQSLL